MNEGFWASKLLLRMPSGPKQRKLMLAIVLTEIGEFPHALLTSGQCTQRQTQTTRRLQFGPFVGMSTGSVEENVAMLVDDAFCVLAGTNEWKERFK